MAMAAAVAGACASQAAPRTVITGWESVATSYPGSSPTLDRLRGGRGRPAGAVTTVSAVMASPDHRHRRPRRVGQVDAFAGPRRAPGPRAAGHRGHVPGGGLGRSRPRDRPLRPRPRSASWPRGSTECGRTGDRRRRRRDRGHPRAGGQPHGVGGGRQSPRPPAHGATTAALGRGAGRRGGGRRSGYRFSGPPRRPT